VALSLEFLKERSRIMRFPLVGALSAVAAALGIYGLVWYEGMTKEEKEEADRLASQYAMTLYNKGLDQLTSHQLSRVQALVQGHFAK
jgi:hypothetical protein